MMGHSILAVTFLSVLNVHHNCGLNGIEMRGGGDVVEFNLANREHLHEMLLLDCMSFINA